MCLHRGWVGGDKQFTSLMSAVHFPDAFWENVVLYNKATSTRVSFSLNNKVYIITINHLQVTAKINVRLRQWMSTGFSKQLFESYDSYNSFPPTVK